MAMRWAVSPVPLPAGAAAPELYVAHWAVVDAADDVAFDETLSPADAADAARRRQRKNLAHKPQRRLLTDSDDDDEPTGRDAAPVPVAAASDDVAGVVERDVLGVLVESPGDPTASGVRALDDAADELGAVMWNANDAVLAHLRHLARHSRLLTPVASSRDAKRHEKQSRAERCGKTAAPSAHGDSSDSDDTDNFGNQPLFDTALELGAGVGVLGLAVAASGMARRVAVTDFACLVPLMQRNLRLNSAAIKAAGAVVCVEACAWATTVPESLTNFLFPSSSPSSSLPPTPSPRRGRPVCGDAGAVVVLLVDALYGNKQSWPKLLATMHALCDAAAATPADDVDDNGDSDERLGGSSATKKAPPDGSGMSAVTFVNFCEQRVCGVEDDFLARLEVDGDGSAWRPDTRATATPNVVGATANALVQPASSTSPWRWEMQVLPARSQLGLPIRCTVIRRLATLPSSFLHAEAKAKKASTVASKKAGEASAAAPASEGGPPAAMAATQGRHEARRKKKKAKGPRLARPAWATSDE